MTKDTKKTLRFAFIAVFVIFISIYTFLGTRDLVFGVKIEQVNIQNGERIEEDVIEIKGKARNASKLTINGWEIPIDQEGNFKETTALLSGYNEISIQAEDKFGNRDEKNYQLMH